jgi:hypothetical protein
MGRRVVGGGGHLRKRSVTHAPLDADALPRTAAQIVAPDLTGRLGLPVERALTADQVNAALERRHDGLGP